MSALTPGSWPTPLLNAVRASNKYLLNPLMVQLAGHKHWYAAAITHTGRRSGKQYTTPVVAERIADGFVIPLPYGTDVDWLRNVRAAGRATISSQGEDYEVAQPEIIDAAEALPMLSAQRRRTFERVGIGGYLRLTDHSPN
ncbi:nitroreductase family deazaflavin-dependent oxidoreductase [Mycobacterium sp. 1245805.9]|uniref:nitroreductase family deazaflavin-dependent oxidoreductase n=1 Tax=Mycobacterium sp. 1245805.9 TaxID=1856862 RepID=UPI00080015ED|nr:nitroreductase family deazaflavin-dependent oxidoreductase [Mycobacterium sp. 1245805.9]OBI88988.1 nitroreductase [Mycobacterium sp. 1245805.9]